MLYYLCHCCDHAYRNKLKSEVQVVRMPGWHSDAQVLNLPLHNPAVVAPIHDEVVEQVGLCILCAGTPRTQQTILKFVYQQYSNLSLLQFLVKFRTSWEDVLAAANSVMLLIS